MEQAPDIERNLGSGKLVYDKERQTIISVPRMSDEATEAKNLTHWAMNRYGITNGDDLYQRVYNALKQAARRGVLEQKVPEK